jgi:hypothetical protein
MVEQSPQSSRWATLLDGTDILHAGACRLRCSRAEYGAAMVMVMVMTTTVFLDRGDGDLSEFEADEAAEYLSAHGVWWRRTQVPTSGARPVYEPSSAPGAQRSKHAWTEQLADEEASALGEGERREMFGD